MIKFIVFVCSLLAVSAHAQEFGALLGLHQTNAKFDSSGTTTEGKLNFKAGLLMAYELIPGGRFKTGAIYNQRHFSATTSGAETKMQFDYIDMPVIFQYNFSQMVGVFGGLVVGINVNDRTEVPSGTTATKPSMEGLYPLGTVGVNFMFEDMIGFDLYYEGGMGKFAKVGTVEVKNYSTFGGNFIYWF